MPTRSSPKRRQSPTRPTRSTRLELEESYLKARRLKSQLSGRKAFGPASAKRLRELIARRRRKSSSARRSQGSSARRSQRSQQLVRDVDMGADLAVQMEGRELEKAGNLDKYDKRRKSPPTSATAFYNRDKTGRGNDGNMYRSVSDKNGIYRWKLV